MLYSKLRARRKRKESGSKNVMVMTDIDNYKKALGGDDRVI